MNTNNTKQKGFIVKMDNGQRFFIPFDRFIDKEKKHTLEVWNYDQSYKATPQEAKEWADRKFYDADERYHEEIIEDCFEGISWDDVEDIAIQLPSEIMSLSDMFDNAEITMV